MTWLRAQSAFFEIRRWVLAAGALLLALAAFAVVSLLALRSERAEASAVASANAARLVEATIGEHANDVRAVGEEALGDPRHRQWVREPGEGGQQQRGDDRANDRADQGKCTAPRTMSISLIPMNGTMSPPSP